VIGAPARVLTYAQDELRALWSIPAGPGQPLRSRACTMNLVVVAPTPALAEEWVSVVDAAIKNVPARAIIVGLEPDGEDTLDATVSAVCSPDSRGEGAVICSERVTLVARGASCGRLSSSIGALSATDVPTTLVWLARVHADDPTFTPLAREASRIVLDTAHSSLASLAYVMRWARARPLRTRPGIGDLAWTRIALWQELCARMFDSPRLLPLAEHVRRVSVVEGSGPSPVIGAEGALLLGWLATRLGWKAASLAGKLRLVRPMGGYVEVALRGQAAPWAPPGALLAFELEAVSPQLSMKGEIVRGAKGQIDSATWRVQVSLNGQLERPLEQTVRLRSSEPARVLERTLHRRLHDEALADATAWADELRGEELNTASPSPP
jgi:glucose-6-phosphate dehydrogenase assembly protein OpcA